MGAAIEAFESSDVVAQAQSQLPHVLTCRGEAQAGWGALEQAGGQPPLDPPPAPRQGREAGSEKGRNPDPPPHRRNLPDRLGRAGAPWIERAWNERVGT